MLTWPHIFPCLVARLTRYKEMRICQVPVLIWVWYIKVFHNLMHTVFTICDVWQCTVFHIHVCGLRCHVHILYDALHWFKCGSNILDVSSVRVREFVSTPTHPMKQIQGCPCFFLIYTNRYVMGVMLYGMTFVAGFKLGRSFTNTLVRGEWSFSKPHKSLTTYFGSRYFW